MIFSEIGRAAAQTLIEETHKRYFSGVAVLCGFHASKIKGCHVCYVLPVHQVETHPREGGTVGWWGGP